MSSHILSEVTEVCDEVALIDHGKLLLHDTLENVTSRFAADGHASVDVALARPVDLGAVSAQVAGLSGVRSCTPLDAKRLRVRFDGGAENQERLLESLVGLRIGVIGLTESESALEEVYLSQVSRGD